jgi:hypothetical protein
VAKRMSLIEGMKRDNEVSEMLDPQVVDNFVKHGTAAPGMQEEVEMPRPVAIAPKQTQEGVSTPLPRPSKAAAAITPGLIPVNVRVRPEIAAALKTASLDRQMQGIEPSAKREIVEQALEPWLRKHGYLN